MKTTTASKKWWPLLLTEHLPYTKGMLKQKDNLKTSHTTTQWLNWLYINEWLQITANVGLGEDESLGSNIMGLKLGLSSTSYKRQKSTTPVKWITDRSIRKLIIK